LNRFRISARRRRATSIALGATLYHLLTELSLLMLWTRATAFITSQPNPLSQPMKSTTPSVEELSEILSRAMQQKSERALRKCERVSRSIAVTLVEFNEPLQSWLRLRRLESTDFE